MAKTGKLPEQNWQTKNKEKTGEKYNEETIAKKQPANHKNKQKWQKTCNGKLDNKITVKSEIKKKNCQKLASQISQHPKSLNL